MNKIVEKRKLKEGEKIPLMYDECAKIMFANPNRMEPLTLLLSRILEVRYEDLEGRIELIPNNEPNKRVGKKKSERDILVRVMTDNTRIILEVNVRGDYDTILNRNLLYLSRLYGNELNSGDSYDKINNIFLINFNTFYVDNTHKKLFDYYYFRNEEGNILTEKQKILNINIEKCYQLWYSQNEPVFKNQYEKDLFYLCAAMVTDKVIEFSDLIGKISVFNEIKKIIEEASLKMTEDGRFDWKNYDLVEEERRISKSILNEVTAKAEKRVEEGVKQGIEQGIEQGIQKGILQKQKEMIINMYNDKVSIETIAKYANLTVAEVKDIIDNIK